VNWRIVGDFLTQVKGKNATSLMRNIRSIASKVANLETPNVKGEGPGAFDDFFCEAANDRLPPPAG